MSGKFSQLNLPNEFSSVEKARDFLKQQLDGTPFAAANPGYEKTLWSIAINAGKDVVFRKVMRHNVVRPELLAPAINFMTETLQVLYSLPNIMHPHLHDQRVGPTNRAYFLMEGYEALWMHSFLGALFKLFQPASIILLHDGIWIQPVPCDQIIDLAAHEACISTGLIGLRLKISSLSKNRDELISTINTYINNLGINRANFENDMLARLARATQGDWWDGLAQDTRT